MRSEEAINVLCASGSLSAESLNTLHACRDKHPWNNPNQWRNAAFVLAGRVFVGGQEHEAVRCVQAMANQEVGQ